MKIFKENEFIKFGGWTFLCDHPSRITINIGIIYSIENGKLISPIYLEKKNTEWALETRVYLDSFRNIEKILSHILYFLDERYPEDSSVFLDFNNYSLLKLSLKIL